MKNMKKFASLGLSLVMMLSLAACGGWFRRRLRCRR